MKVTADSTRRKLNLDVVRKRKHYPLADRGCWEEELVVAYGIKGGDFKCVVIELQREKKDCKCYVELYSQNKFGWTFDSLSGASTRYKAITEMLDSVRESAAKTREYKSKDAA